VKETFLSKTTLLIEVCCIGESRMSPTPDPIKHVILLLLENRSFDEMLGCFREKYPELEGIDPLNLRSNTDDSGRSFQQQVTREVQMSEHHAALQAFGEHLLGELDEAAAAKIERAAQAARTFARVKNAIGKKLIAAGSRLASEYQTQTRSRASLITQVILARFGRPL
jgi:hypothetical protein